MDSQLLEIRRLAANRYSNEKTKNNNGLTIGDILLGIINFYQTPAEIDDKFKNSYALYLKRKGEKYGDLTLRQIADLPIKYAEFVLDHAYLGGFSVREGTMFVDLHLAS